MLCVDNYTTVDTFPVFLSFLYQWTSPHPLPRAPRTAARPNAPLPSPRAPQPVTLRMVLEGAMKLHSKLSSPAVEAGLTSASDSPSGREKLRVDLWLASIQQLCVTVKVEGEGGRGGDGSRGREAMECLYGSAASERWSGDGQPPCLAHLPREAPSTHDGSVGRSGGGHGGGGGGEG